MKRWQLIRAFNDILKQYLKIKISIICLELNWTFKYFAIIMLIGWTRGGGLSTSHPYIHPSTSINIPTWQSVQVSGRQTYPLHSEGLNPVYVNQSINHLINKSINKLTNCNQPPTILPINYSIILQSINPLFNTLKIQSNNQPINLPNHQLMKSVYQSKLTNLVNWPIW